MKNLYWFFVFSVWNFSFVLLFFTFFSPNYVHYVSAADNSMTHQQEVWIHTLEYCESNGRSDSKIMDSNDRYSYGVLMFQMETFLREGKKYGIIDEKITAEKAEKIIYDANTQEKIAHQMLLKGGERNWFNCVKTKLHNTKYPK